MSPFELTTVTVLNWGSGLYRGAIGIIETLGQVGSVEAADAMTKAASVQLLGREDVGGGYHSVTVRGDVGSVRAALESGARAAGEIGKVLGVLLIPRPHDDLDTLFGGRGLLHGAGDLPPPRPLEPPPAVRRPAPARPQKTDTTRETSSRRPPRSSKPRLPSAEDLDDMNVHSLRTLARSLPSFPLQGREISAATRKELLRALRRRIRAMERKKGRS